jgi:threonylcarbamoyladenosine tRNA methylthiotransferase MtaB
VKTLSGVYLLIPTFDKKSGLCFNGVTFQTESKYSSLKITMDNKPVVALYTLGCKLNQAETESLASQFAQIGFRVTSNDNADICIINTCTVTHIADRKSRHLLRLLRKNNPEALIVATGCYAERIPQYLADLGVDLVVDNKQKMILPELVRKRFGYLPVRAVEVTDIDSSLRVRSFIKIQDGCNDFCAYCIVPLVRGRELCLPREDIIDMIKAKSAAGYKEIILTGTKIGSYSYNGVGLKQFVGQILNDTDIPRLHLSSLQPQEITKDLLNLWTDPRLNRHFHIALQSGSNTVLKRMKRRYSLEDYGKVVLIIRQMVPGVAITTDIMVGFPGETDKDFEESYSFCRSMEFAAIHVFSYSSRRGTVAAGMTGQVNDKLKKMRSLRMLALARDSASVFQEKFLGQIREVLWETESKPESNLYSGLSDNYIRVYTYSNRSLSDSISKVRLIKPCNDGLWGEIVS